MLAAGCAIEITAPARLSSEYSTMAAASAARKRKTPRPTGELQLDHEFHMLWLPLGIGCG
jgi:hypothetical protein